MTNPNFIVEAPAESGSSRVHYFVSGENEWSDSPSWPPAGTAKEIFLSSAAREGSPERKGAVLFERPSAVSSRACVYDLAEAVETVGGVIVSAFRDFARSSGEYAADGVQDQRPLEQRQDVLVYTSDELAETVRVAGPGEGQSVDREQRRGHRLLRPTDRCRTQRIRRERGRGLHPHTLSRGTTAGSSPESRQSSSSKRIPWHTPFCRVTGSGCRSRAQLPEIHPQPELASRTGVRHRCRHRRRSADDSPRP